MKPIRIDKKIKPIDVKDFDKNAIYDAFDYVDFANARLKCVPIKFLNAFDSFNVYGNSLRSLYGVPEFCRAAFICSKNKLQSFEHAPITIAKHADFSNNLIRSMCGINDRIQAIGGSLNVSNNPIEEGGIGVLLISSIKEIQYDFTTQTKNAKEFKQAVRIINSYLRQEKRFKAHLLTCANELDDAGLGRFAKL